MKFYTTDKRLREVLDNMDKADFSASWYLSKSPRGQKRKKREITFKETLCELLSMRVIPETVPEELLKTPLGDKITYQEAILLVQIIKASNGDTQSASYIRDTTGNKPKESKSEEQLRLETVLFDGE